MYEIEAKNISVTTMINNHRCQSGVNSAGARRGFSGTLLQEYSSSVPEGKLMGVELIGVYKSGSINWG